MRTQALGSICRAPEHSDAPRAIVPSEHRGQVELDPEVLQLVAELGRRPEQHAEELSGPMTISAARSEHRLGTTAPEAIYRAWTRMRSIPCLHDRSRLLHETDPGERFGCTKVHVTTAPPTTGGIRVGLGGGEASGDFVP